MTKNGGWVWIQSYLTIVHNSRSSRPHCIVSVNYVLTEKLEPDLILNAEQISSVARPGSAFTQSPTGNSQNNSSNWLDFNDSASPSPNSNGSRRARRAPATPSGASAQISHALPAPSVVTANLASHPQQISAVSAMNHHYSPEPVIYGEHDPSTAVQHDQRLMPNLASFEYQGDFSSQLTEVAGKDFRKKIMEFSKYIATLYEAYS